MLGCTGAGTSDDGVTPDPLPPLDLTTPVASGEVVAEVLTDDSALFGGIAPRGVPEISC